jgi:hypothetical protein
VQHFEQLKDAIKLPSTTVGLTLQESYRQSTDAGDVSDACQVSPPGFSWPLDAAIGYVKRH